MIEKNKVVMGIFNSRSDAERAIDILKTDGFLTTDISVLIPDNKFGAQKFADDKDTKVPEGAATGAGTGAVIGGTLGLLAGVGALAIPGFGPLLAAGPIMAVLAGVGVGGAVGGIGGALIGLGISEREATRYESTLKSGGILLSIHMGSSDEVSKAKMCLERAGAKDISTTADAKSEWWPKQNPTKETIISKTI
jgi:hypothetical protein